MATISCWAAWPSHQCLQLYSMLSSYLHFRTVHVECISVLPLCSLLSLLSDPGLPTQINVCSLPAMVLTLSVLGFVLCRITPNSRAECRVIKKQASLIPLHRVSKLCTVKPAAHPNSAHTLPILLELILIERVTHDTNLRGPALGPRGAS